MNVGNVPGRGFVPTATGPGTVPFVTGNSRPAGMRVPSARGSANASNVTAMVNVPNATGRGEPRNA